MYDYLFDSVYSFFFQIVMEVQRGTMIMRYDTDGGMSRTVVCHRKWRDAIYNAS